MSRVPRFGFTVIEVLVTVSIISLIIALLLPAVQQARESARRIACRNNLRQVGIGITNYESSFRVLPPGSQIAMLYGSRPYSKSFGWTIAILPYVEQSQLYARFDFDLDCQIHHRELTHEVVSLFVCPSDPNGDRQVEWNGEGEDLTWGEYYKGGWGGLNYLGVSGNDGFLPVDSRSNCDKLNAYVGHLHSGLFFGNSSIRFSEITDGISNTLMLGERGITSGVGKWGGAGVRGRCPAGLADVLLPGFVISKADGGVRPPEGSLADEMRWWSWHVGGTQFCLSDGSVRFVSNSVERSVVMALASRSGGETTPDW